MAQYRKKPVVIDAFQIFPGCVAPWWFAEALARKDAYYIEGKDGQPILLLKTEEGAMEASINDFVIKGVKGEIYACKPDIFAMTYEAVV